MRASTLPENIIMHPLQFYAAAGGVSVEGLAMSVMFVPGVDRLYH